MNTLPLRDGNQQRLGVLPVAAIVTAGSNLISSIFGGKPEDTSSVGFNNYMNSVPPLPAYPPLEVVLAAVQGVAPADQINSIRATYNQRDGVIKHGDWYARVDSVSPITLRWFKGAGETGYTRTSKYWTPPATAVQQQQVVAPGSPAAIAQKNNNTLIIAGAAVLTAATVATVVIVNRKKKKKK